jgi:hypothetical protein
MIFTLAANLAFFLLAPLGSVTLVLGDWMLNAYIAAKIVENFIPNGPAVVGNFSAIFPVLFNVAKSAVEPVFQVNYTQVLDENGPNITEWLDQMKTYMSTTRLSEVNEF